ncbi:hypothetical protein [Pseudomonas fluorescens]|uniref:Uncharacterized protein n=1 Tax=Pseudomonas fluorescens TaxID=294 RepID=A0A423LW40_PSEFL|nr:hypothetical protein [Pseudomonas fluorescens]RON72530.1 hypothetical protein BK671_01360 [Pseudomonas fluorescens]
MSSYTLKQIVAMAKENSPIYQQLYKDIAPGELRLEELPVLTHEELMRVVQDQDAIRFFNCSASDGIVYQSSATTGQPKATMFGRDEWQATVKLLAVNHWRSRTLRAGDVVANLCVGGSASFMFVHGTIENFPGRCSELPIGSDHDFDYLIDTCEKFSVNVLAGINSTFLGIAHHLLCENRVFPRIERILCGGELFYGEQLALVKSAFPNAEIVPFMFATTETGLIGLSEPGYAQNVFSVCDDACLLEIVDPESKKVITQTDKRGLAVVTSLLRTAAPAIRVEIGDYAQWIDPPGSERRRFSIHGRRYLKQYAFYNARISETDIHSLILVVAERVDLLKLSLQIDNGICKFFVALASDKFDQVVIEDVIRTALAAVKPEVVIPTGELQVELVDFSYFLDGIRRKGRVISNLGE